jgi:hypothetical protein
MAWNLHAHGSALHFVTRVTAFRQAVGAAAVPLADKVFGYPRALVEEAPVAAVLGVAGALALSSLAFRTRWAWPGATALAVLVFLVWGDVHDGAPTHHAARALVAVWWVLVAAGVDAAFVLGHDALQHRPLVRWGAALVGTGAVVASAVGWSNSPGRTPAEQREPQIARGLDMRSRGVAAADLTPCAFEHFALLAAWGEPERATIGMRTGAVPSADCPRVIEH